MASALVLTPRRSKQCASACESLEEQQAAQADETALETPDKADADESCEAWAASGYCHHEVKQMKRLSSSSDHCSDLSRPECSQKPPSRPLVCIAHG